MLILLLYIDVFTLVIGKVAFHLLYPSLSTSVNNSDNSSQKLSLISTSILKNWKEFKRIVKHFLWINLLRGNCI